MIIIVGFHLEGEPTIINHENMFIIKYTDNPKKPAHEDIFVTWQKMKLDKVVDSYFFVLDEGSLPQFGMFHKAATVLTYILSDWKSAIQKMRDDETVYLPFDFSDEYIGFLKATLTHQELTICYGATRKLFGWNIDPMESVPLPINSEDEAFLDHEIISISVNDFVDQIEQNIRNIGK